MTQAKINPVLLQWARQRIGLTQEQLAKKVGLGDRLTLFHAWEEGRESPTFRQAQGLSNALHVPLGYLFLQDPPATTLPLADFRALPESERGKFSPDLEDTLNDALRKRDWLRERRIQEGWSPLPFVGRFSPTDQSEAIVADIRQTLALNLPPARDAKTWAEHLKLLVRHAEETGIMVLQSGYVLSNTRRRLSVEEFRGFTLSDEYAPLIFINARDSINGRIFTLAHELGHLWTGTSGISNPEITPTPPHGTSTIERLCNQVAAELLVPASLLGQEWQRGANVLETAQGLTKQFRVSILVILIRAYELGLIAQSEFQGAYAQALQEIQKIPVREETGGGDFYRTFQNRNGRLLIREIATALQEGAVLYQEASHLLNVRPQTLEEAVQRF